MRRALVPVLILFTTLLPPLNARANGAAGTTIRASLTAEGRQADEDSYLTDVSDDGRFVAFASEAGLAPADTDWRFDVYLRDTAAEQTELISVRPDGASFDRETCLLGMTGDAGKVFLCVESADYRTWTVWLRDRTASTTERVVGGIVGAAPSPDGNWMVVVAPSSTSRGVVRIRSIEIATGTRTLVARLRDRHVGASVADTGDVAFSTDEALVAADIDGLSDIYLWDEGDASLALISDSEATVGFDQQWPTIAATGDAVVYFVEQGWTERGIEVWERDAGVTHVADAYRNEFAGGALGITPDARFILYVDGEPDEHGNTAVRLVDRSSATTERVDVNDLGMASENDARPMTPSLSPDGRFVAFASASAQMTPSDSNGRYDVFLRDRQGVPALTGAPDLMVRFRGSTYWDGAGEIDPYRDEGYSGVDLHRGETTVARIRIYNVGNAEDAFGFRGKGSNRWSRVRYFVGDLDVTDAVVAGAYQTRLLAPGQRQALRMEVRLRPVAERGDYRTFLLRSWSLTTNAWKDFVRIGFDVY
jgi:hypothetical protein